MARTTTAKPSAKTPTLKRSEEDEAPSTATVGKDQGHIEAPEAGGVDDDVDKTSMQEKEGQEEIKEAASDDAGNDNGAEGNDAAKEPKRMMEMEMVMVTTTAMMTLTRLPMALMVMDPMAVLQQHGVSVDEFVNSATQKKPQSALMQEKTFDSCVELRTNKLDTAASSGTESFVSSMDGLSPSKVGNRWDEGLI